MSRTLIFILGIALFAGCSSKDEKKRDTSTSTSGSITIAVDESLKPLIEAEVEAFQGSYKNAHIRVIYVSEGEAIEALLKDSVRACVVTRYLTSDEELVLTSQTYKARQLKIALDAIALIVNRQNPDTLISLADVKKILSGEIKNWKWSKTKGKVSAAGMEVVFDHPNSGIIRYMKDSLIRVDSLPGNWFALKGNSAVFDYVSQTPHALGLIDLSWISDRDDSTANKFRGAVKVMGISTDSGFYQPYQAYIAQKVYPLRRDVIMISRETRTGLASGLMSFMAGQKGQRVVLKSGLVPATMPVRIVEISREPFK